MSVHIRSNRPSSVTNVKIRTEELFYIPDKEEIRRQSMTKRAVPIHTREQNEERLGENNGPLGRSNDNRQQIIDY